MPGCDDPAVIAVNSGAALPIHDQTVHGATELKLTAMALEASHQCVDDSRTPAHGVVKAGVVTEPFPEQCGHRRSVRVAHRHPADQKAQQVNPVPQERVLEMAIHQGTEGTSEVTHRRKMFHQPRALLQQLPHDIHPGAQGKQWKSIGRRCNRLQGLDEPLPFLHGGGAFQMSDGCLEISWTDTDGTVTFRQQDIPIPVLNHR